VTLLRIQRTSASQLTRTFFLDESPTDSSTTPTVAVTRLDGTAVTSGSATHPGPPGQYQFTLPGGPTSPASATWQLDTLLVAWTGTLGGALVTLTDTVEVVGGFLFGVPELRVVHKTLSNTSTFPTSLLAANRIKVEQECERICRQAFVPRFGREVLSGRDTDRLGTRYSMLRKLRSVTVSGVAWSAGDVNAVAVSESGMLTRPGGAVWPAGVGNIVVEVEHGWDQPPEEIRDAAMLRLRSRVTRPASGVPDRVESYSNEAGTYRMSMPSRQKTGIPDVDADYERYTRERRAVFA
jgi:hypothetical protein